jgi:hypothetical protein
MVSVRFDRKFSLLHSNGAPVDLATVTGFACAKSAPMHARLLSSTFCQ